MITESETNMATDINTQNLDENGEFSATMEYGKMITTKTISGKTTTEEKPYSGISPNALQGPFLGKLPSKLC